MVRAGSSAARLPTRVRPRPYGDPMGARPGAKRRGSAVLGAAPASVAIIITWLVLSALPLEITPYHLGLLLPWAAVIIWRVHRRPRRDVPPLRYVLRDKTGQRPPILVDSANVDMSVIRWYRPNLDAGHWPEAAVMLSALARSLGRNEPVWNESYAEELGIAVEPVPTMDDSAGAGRPRDDAVAQQRPGRSYRPQSAAAAVVGALGVCLPFLATRNDPPREWGGLVLLGHTLLAALLVLIAGGLLVALGRIRPMAAAFGRGVLLGALLGGVLWAVLLIVVPGPRPGPLPQTPPQPSRAASILPTGRG